MTSLSCWLLVAPSWAADDPLGTIDAGPRQAQVHRIDVAVRGGAGLMFGGPDRAWGPGGYGALVVGVPIAWGVSAQLIGGLGGHSLDEPEALLAEWTGPAALSGSLRHVPMHAGIRWAMRPGQVVEPWLAGGLGVSRDWTRVDVPSPGGVTRLDSKALVPMASLEFGVRFRLMDHLGLGVLAQATSGIAFDAAEVSGSDVVRLTWRAGPSLELSSRF